MQKQGTLAVSVENMKKDDYKAKLMLFTTALIWGAGFIASQLALDSGLSSQAVMLGRFSIAAVMMLIMSFKGIVQNIKKEHLKSGIIIGVLLFVAFTVQIIGLEYSTPSNNALITATNVVIVPFLWWAASKLRPIRITFIASFLCLAGVSLLSVDFSAGFSFGVGDLLTLFAAFLFACQIVATGILAPKMDFRVLVFLQLAVAALCALVVFLFTDGDFSSFLRPRGFAALLYLGTFSTCVCYFLQTKAQVRVPSSTAAIILSTESLFGAVFSVMVGYDKLDARLVAGGIIIFCSVILPDIWLRFNESK